MYCFGKARCRCAIVNIIFGTNPVTDSDGGNIMRYWRITTLIALICIAGGSLAGDFPSRGLRAHWPLAADANDTVGNLTGVVNNVEFVNKDGIKCARFNGTNSVIRIDPKDAVFVSSNTMTVSAWVYVGKDWPEKDGCIIGRGGWTDGWRVTINRLDNALIPNMISLGLGGKTRWSLWGHTPQLEPETWYHIATTWDGIWGKYYVNGKSSVGYHYTGDYTPEKFWLGLGYNELGAGHFKGALRDVCVWSRALSRVEVASVYAAQKIATGAIPLPAGTTDQKP